MNDKLFNPFEVNRGKSGMKLNFRYLSVFEVVYVFIAIRAFELNCISIREFQFVEICLRLIKKTFPAGVVSIAIYASHRVCGSLGKCFFAMIGIYLVQLAVKFDIAPLIFFAVVYLIIVGADHLAIFEYRFIMGMVLASDPEYSGFDICFEQILVGTISTMHFRDTRMAYTITEEVHVEYKRLGLSLRGENE